MAIVVMSLDLKIIRRIFLHYFDIFSERCNRDRAIVRYICDGRTR